jgi:hypothetical protein
MQSFQKWYKTLSSHEGSGLVGKENSENIDKTRKRNVGVSAGHGALVSSRETGMPEVEEK